MSLLSRLVLFAILLAFLVVGLGAYTRLTHAGLGCPDWPGCYGFIDVPNTSEQIKQAEAAFPERPVEPHKAWNEMIHRYFAGALGLLILAISIVSIKLRKLGAPVKLPLAILAVVTFQAALGMWTVTMKLMPVVVMGHLLGGFTTLCLLFLLFLRLKKLTPIIASNMLQFKKLAYVALAILALQISLGGWTSSNYAALVCTELPICQQGWVEELSFENSFALIPPEKATYEFGHLDHHERVTIHVMHRIGAIITMIIIAWLAFSVLLKTQVVFLRRTAIFVLVLLLLQVALGVSNIVFSLPLGIAVAHNVVAVALLMSLIALTYYLTRKVGVAHGHV